MKMGTTHAILALLLAAASARAAFEPLPRIAPQAAKPVARFVDEAGNIFSAVGVNYVRLGWVDQVPYHTTINAALYDPIRPDRDFREISAVGYNVVRIFVDHGDPAHQAMKQYGMAAPIAFGSATISFPEHRRCSKPSTLKR